MTHAQFDPLIDPIRLSHSPDPDDAFMFYGLALGRVDTEGLRFEHQLVDIETLNQRAFRGELEVTALSVHAYAHLSDRYLLLNTGASMGVGYGPMVIAREATAARGPGQQNHRHPRRIHHRLPHPAHGHGEV